MRSYSSSERRLNSPRQPFVDAAGFGEGSRRSMSWMRLLDQEQAGRFERLEEAAGETDAHAIAFPRLRAATGAKLQQPAARPAPAVELRQQGGARFVFADECVANTWPLPVRCCSGMRQIQPAASAPSSACTA